MFFHAFWNSNTWSVRVFHSLVPVSANWAVSVFTFSMSACFAARLASCSVLRAL